MTWQAEVLRFTGFIPGVSPDLSKGVWGALIGKDPETQITKPQQSLLSEAGPWGPGILAININPIRVDFVLRTRPPKGDEPPPESLGDFDEVIDAYDEKIRMLLELDQLPPLTRLAYGAVLRIPVGTMVDAMNLLNDFLPAVDIDPESSDLTYRINRKRTLHVGEKDIVFNRLNTWRIIRSGFISIDLVSKGALHSQDTNLAAILELDISTAPSKEPFGREELNPIYSTLRNLGTEIAEKGDIL